MQSSTVTPVWVQNDESREIGQGVFLKSEGGCFLYTAGHVLVQEGRRASTVTYRFRGVADFFGKVLWAPLEDSPEFDIGAVQASAGATPETCPNLPTATRTDKALAVGQGEILLIGQNGNRRRIPVRIVSEQPIIVVRPASTRDGIQEGDSGAPLVVDGIVVGLVSSVDNGGAEPQINVIRIDAAPAKARAWFAPSSAPEIAPVSLVDANQILAMARADRPDADIGQVAALETLNLAGKGISGLDFAAVSFAGAKLPKLVARNVDFTLSNLSDVEIISGDLNGIILHFADLERGKFRSTAFDDSYGIFFDATGADFSSASLTGVAWRGPVLTGANFQNANLDGASLAFADLRGADFRGAKFNDLILIGSDLRGAKFDGSKARSIDVTGALFDDATFPVALQSALCGTLSVDDIQLYVLETFAPTIRSDRDYFDIGKKFGGIIPLRNRADRYFPPCPGRADKWRKAMIRGTQFEDRTELIDPRIGVNLPTALIKMSARRQRVEAAVEGAVARGRQREALLDTSNHFYRDRPARLLRQTRERLTAARPKSPLWLNELTLEMLALVHQIKPVVSVNLAKSRLNEERYASKFYTVPLNANQNWGALFPPDFITQDLSPEVRELWLNWGRRVAPKLPADVRIAIGDVSRRDQPNQNRLQVSRVEDIIYPYDSAFDEKNANLRRARAADCIIAVGPPYNPARKTSAQRRLNYYGTNQLQCERSSDLEADKRQIFGGDWYVGKAFLDITLANGDIWIIAVDRAPPAQLTGNDGVLRPGTIAGRLTKVMKLPEHNQCPLGAPHLFPEKCRYPGYLIVLENAQFIAN